MNMFPYQAGPFFYPSAWYGPSGQALLSLTKVLEIPVFGTKRLQWSKAGPGNEWGVDTDSYQIRSFSGSSGGMGMTFPM